MVQKIVSLLIGQRKPVIDNSKNSSNIDRLEILTGKIVASKSTPKGSPPSFYDLEAKEISQGN